MIKSNNIDGKRWWWARSSMNESNEWICLSVRPYK
jgi:hypothetical protein